MSGLKLQGKERVVKSLVSGVALAVLLTSSATAAVSASPKSQSSGTRVLAQGLKAVIAPAVAASAQGSGQSQGAVHASPRAILVVCSKNTPAAQRAAICNGEGVTPN